MFVLAASGIGMAFVGPDDQPELRRIIFDLHTTRGFSALVKVIYTIGTMGFLVQGVTGVVMWWDRRRRQPDRAEAMGTANQTVG